MLREERLQAMLRVLNEQEFLTVEELSQRLMVSRPTIRRDLADLAQRRLIVRSHGGAMRAPDEKITTPIGFRRSVHAREKSLISREAAKLIRGNTVIYLDASTTAAYITEYLRPQQQVTVVTNGLMTAVRLQSKGIRTYCLGGEIVGSSLASGGPIALDGARNFNVDLMFFSSYGINDQGTSWTPRNPRPCCAAVSCGAPPPASSSATAASSASSPSTTASPWGTWTTSSPTPSRRRDTRRCGGRPS